MARPSVLALPVLLFTSSCVIAIGDGAREQAREERHATFALDGAATVRVEGRNGSLRVVQGGGGEIDCEALLTAWADTRLEAEDELAAMAVVAERSGSVLRIHVDIPPGLHRWAAAMNLRVPAGIALDLDTSNGRIVVEDPFPTVRADTSNAAVEVRCAGRAELATSNGSVALSGPVADFDIHTSNASVTVDLIGDWSGRGEVRTSNGAIALSCSGRLRAAATASTSNGRIRGVENLRREAGGFLVLRTSNADITLSAPD